LQNSISIRILGQEYKVRTSGDHAYVQALSQYINEMVADVQRQGKAVTTMDVIAITMLNMADDVNKSRTELQSLKETLDKRFSQLIEKIDAGTALDPWGVRGPS